MKISKLDPHMDGAEFKKCATELVNMLANYYDNIRERVVLPDVKPGYIRELVPDSPPERSEDWRDVLKDIEKVVMTGMTHWNHPHFFAFFPAGSSFPSVCADILMSALTCIGFTWMASPACTELEMVMMDWLGKALGLPEHFLFESNGLGGGSIQSNASEATLIALLSARNRTLKQIKNATLEQLVVYASDQSHCSVEKAALLGAVKIRLLPTDDNLSFKGDTLLKAIKEDREKGFIPFMFIGTLGTTSACSFDNIKEIGPICNEHNMWLHIDAAYAGASFVCPEFRHLCDGIEFTDSFSFNPHKWLLITFDCSTLWVKNRNELTEAFAVDASDVKDDIEGPIPDYRHWHIPFGRRFRALKLWFVFRMYGLEGLRQYIRKYVELAKEFEALVAKDKNWTILYPVHLSVICFRFKGTDEENDAILKLINERKNIYIISTTVHGQFMLRFSICSRFSTSQDIEFAWSEIKTVASLLKLI